MWACQGVGDMSSKTATYKPTENEPYM
ncbi:MAG: hypothetical protein RIR41_3810, partial [Pseudomonadota bacterium]